jgi:predicted transposase YbfD/YdcC
MQLFLTSFATVPDPRAGNVRHNLVETLFVAFIALLCGAATCCEMSELGRAKFKFFKKFLKLPHGIPSHDTFSAVLRMVDPKALDAAFRVLMAEFGTALSGAGIVAVDGKSLKHAYDKGSAHMPKMMVSAYAADVRMTLASVAAVNGNEVDAALEVLGLIDLKGVIVTADALHCHRKMAALVIDKGGDYCLRLKGNQDALLTDAHACLTKVRKAHPSARTEDRGHGRVEARHAVVVDAKDAAARLNFPGLKAFGSITSIRKIDGKTETDTRIFALSRKLAPSALLTTVRAHWQIENALHWELDVVLREDAARNRKDHGPANIAVLRRLALNAVRADTSKGSLNAKIKRAGWDDGFLPKLLTQMR